MRSSVNTEGVRCGTVKRESVSLWGRWDSQWRNVWERVEMYKEQRCKMLTGEVRSAGICEEWCRLR